MLFDDFSRASSILRHLKIARSKDRPGRWDRLFVAFLSPVFPFDKIKIDKSFVWMVQQNPQSAAIIRAVVGLGRDLSMHILAEGVETLDQLSFLRDGGCSTLQGYLIGRPYPIELYAKEVGKRAAGQSNVEAAEALAMRTGITGDQAQDLIDRLGDDPLALDEAARSLRASER
ncbi:EAL domain-containing protein [Mesorhizobium sp. M1312]